MCKVTSLSGQLTYNVIYNRNSVKLTLYIFNSFNCNIVDPFLFQVCSNQENLK